MYHVRLTQEDIRHIFHMLDIFREYGTRYHWLIDRIADSVRGNMFLEEYIHLVNDLMLLEKRARDPELKQYVNELLDFLESRIDN